MLEIVNALLPIHELIILLHSVLEMMELALTLVVLKVTASSLFLVGKLVLEIIIEHNEIVSLSLVIL